jgi:hypothetical protein
MGYGADKPIWAGQETNLLTTNAVRAALNRKTIGVQDRREFWIVVDEVQEVPGRVIAEVTEHSRKFKVHLIGLNQTPERLDQTAWTALETNASLLMASSMSADGGAKFKREWAGKADPSNLDLWTFLCSARVGQSLTDPFLVHGTLTRDTWASVWREDGPELVAAAVRKRPGLRPASEVLSDLETLDDRIIVGLAAQAGDNPPPRTQVRKPAVAPKTGGVMVMPTG